jgi:hypothetical protein
LRDRLDPELLLQRPDLLRPEAGNRQDFDQTRRHGGLEVFKEFQPPGRVQFGDLLGQGLADALHLLQGAGRDALLEFILADRLDYARPALVGAGLEGILALQLHQGADLGQDSGDLGLIHTGDLTTKTTNRREAKVFGHG